MNTILVIRLSRAGQLACKEPRLVENLTGAQVAVESGLTGGTKRAREGAARLRGDAERRAAAAMLHQHGFDLFAVGELKESFGGLAVARALNRHRFDRRKRDAALAQRRAQLLRERGHVVGAAEQLLRGGTIELAQTIRSQVVFPRKIVGVGKTGARHDVSQPYSFGGHRLSKSPACWTSTASTTSTGGSSSLARTALRSFQTRRLTPSI